LHFIIILKFEFSKLPALCITRRFAKSRTELQVLNIRSLFGFSACVGQTIFKYPAFAKRAGRYMQCLRQTQIWIEITKFGNNLLE